MEKPNFGLSGALAKDERHGNMYRGVQLKWSEPADACMPKRRWRLYVFKKGEMIGECRCCPRARRTVSRD